MTTACKCTIIRPSLDSLFVFELTEVESTKISILDNYFSFGSQANTILLESKLSPNSPKIILHRYEEFITWKEILERKNELRPDLKYELDRLGLLDNIENLNAISEGPNFNPFSLTHTRVATYETFDDWLLNYNWACDMKKNTESKFNELYPNLNRGLDAVSNTVYEKLYIDGILTNYNEFKQLW